MEFHPIANIFPLMEGQEFEDLCKDIAAHGLIEPIWVHNEIIIDGRNRYRACEKVGIVPDYREYKGEESELLAFVISLNLKRRHLNESQRAVIAGKLAKRPLGDQRSPNLETVLTAPEAAKILNVSNGILYAAKAVEKDAPDLLPAIERGDMTVHEAGKEIKRRQLVVARAELAESAKDIPVSERWNIYQADMQTWQAPRQYDYIITDPPYPKEYLYLYEALAARAKEWLKPGGLLVAMCAHYHIDQIYKMLGTHLQYYWTAAYMVPGGQSSVAQRRVVPQWKPLLIYSLGEYSGKTFNDVFESGANDKDFHKWGQSVSGMYNIVSKICLPGQAILDPFCGAGTTGIAAIQHGCIFDGLDILKENCGISIARIGEVQNGMA